MDALHRRVRQIENDDVRAKNKRLRMMLDCNENRTRAAWRELDCATWHYHHLRRWSITVENLLPPPLLSKVGHMARDCKGKAIATGANTRPTVTCYDCGEKGHTRNYCPKKRDPQGEEARGRAYVIRDAEKQQGPNVVTGTFLLNNRYATVLFDSGSDKSFVNTSFSHLIDINPVRLDTSYEVELADGRVVSTNTILRGCTLNLLNHLFKIDLMPIELGTFDVVIGMDWLVDQDAVIVGHYEFHNAVLVNHALRYSWIDESSVKPYPVTHQYCRSVR
ncbi:reverse transcriptase domain-containing protein [Tanacetum coccineum]